MGEKRCAEVVSGQVSVGSRLKIRDLAKGGDIQEA
jgi:hypothetical protein